MLKRKNRLLKFNKKTTTKSKNINTSLFGIKISENGEDESKFAFVVSKKIDKRAVIRNKTKRVLKVAIKNLLNKIQAGKTIIIFAKTSLDFSKEKETEGIIENIFKKEGIIK